MAKLTKTTVTKHERGFFGRVWQIVFWAFQALMIWMMFLNVGGGAELASECTGEYAASCEAGTAIGTGIIAIAGWFIWFLGTLVLAVFMFATRGKAVTYDVE